MSAHARDRLVQVLEANLAHVERWWQTLEKPNNQKHEREEHAND
jgi:hypothetical protein